MRPVPQRPKNLKRTPEASRFSSYQNADLWCDLDHEATSQTPGSKVARSVAVAAFRGFAARRSVLPVRSCTPTRAPLVDHHLHKCRRHRFDRQRSGSHHAPLQLSAIQLQDGGRLVDAILPATWAAADPSSSGMPTLPFRVCLQVSKRVRTSSMLRVSADLRPLIVNPPRRSHRRKNDISSDRGE
jgi:hypothetical protein